VEKNTVEGIVAAQAVRELLRSRGHSAFLLEAVYDVVFEGRDCEEAVRGFVRDFSY
jgi:glycerol-3-phosphate dehydrogenase